jgi:hypothetical protein
MTHNRICQGLAVIFLTIASSARPAEPFPARNLLTAPQLSARIDQRIAARWKEKGVQPAPLAADAEFFRRLALDLNGRIPSVLQVRDFLDDPRPDKRRRWIEELIRSADYRPLFVRHWANYWHAVLFSRTTNQRAPFIVNQLDPWLREQVQANVPYDRMVRELLTGDEGVSFYRANEDKPENLAGNTARLFLGINLECAQCHDHPIPHWWKRRQFWETAAFFAPRPSTGKIQFPNTEQVIQARFLDGSVPRLAEGSDPRAALAEWMTSPRNPYFARAVVNRLWEYFFGVGLTDPADAMSPENPPSHPELLDELAGQFVAHGFDLQYLIEALVGSRAYELTSRQTHPSQDDRRLFARMAVRGLSPQQRYDSFLEALGITDQGVAGPSLLGSPPVTPRAEFLARFTERPDQRAARQTSILQALYLMNGSFLEEALTNSKTLATVQANVSSPVARNITELYLAVLSRQPTPEELGRLRKYVENGGPTRERKAALADIFWALLNSGEFALNH